MMEIGSQDKPDGRSIQGIKCKGLCNNIEKRRSSQQVAGKTTKNWVNNEIRTEIYSPMFLYSQKGQFTTVGSRL